MGSKRACAAVLLMVFALAGTVRANWPQWRGPNSNGTTANARNLPVKWTQTENVAWRTKLPSWSAATPIVWNDVIFVTSAEEGSLQLQGGRRRPAGSAPDKIFLIALNRKDGSIRWRQQIDSGNQIFRKQNSASPSPITDGAHVWIMTGNGKLSCLTMDGKQVWTRDIQADYGKFGLNHGYGSTPLLHGDRLYVEVLHGMLTDDPSYVFAVDKNTGKTIWKVIRPTDAESESPDNYATPQMAVVNGKDQLVISGADYVTGHDPDTGKELWRLGGFNPTRNPAGRTIASSLVVGNYVVTASTRGSPTIAFKLGGAGNVTGKVELWNNNLGADVPTPTTDGKLIYMVSDNGVMNCVEGETGKVVYRGQRLEYGTYSASPLLADGKLYMVNEEGTTTVIKAGPTFEILGANKLDDFTLASPVAVDNMLLIRTSEYLYNIQNK